MRQFLIRPLTVAALVVPVTAGVLVLSSPAGATGHHGAQPHAAATTCKKLSGGLGSGDTVSSCTKSTTGGSGTFAGLTTSPGTVTWANGGSSVFSFTYTVLTKSKCPGGLTEVTLTGSVTKSTGKASAVSGAVSATVCANASAGTIALLKGTKFAF
ncbi:MAG TPA: hypothetical protein VED63_06390 [Acidimicrobiales bacterium]|nr:hypothetical protein [Acidimicrobiales bacterium]